MNKLKLLLMMLSTWIAAMDGLSIKEECRKDLFFYGNKLTCSFTDVENICEQLQMTRDIRAYKLRVMVPRPLSFSLSCFPAPVSTLHMIAPTMTDLYFEQLRPDLTFLKLDTNLPLTLHNLTNVPNLQLLQIHSENPDAFPRDLRDLANLKYLWIKYVPLTDAHFRTFPTGLRQLGISDTPLRSIPCDFLRSMTKLTYLQIRRNQLETFNTSCFPRNVKFLDLSYNNIKKIDLSPFSSLPYLSLRINHNPISCDCDFFKQTVEFLGRSSFSLSASYRRKYVTCTPGPLSAYPWYGKQAERLISHDNAHFGCLKNY